MQLEKRMSWNWLSITIFVCFEAWCVAADASGCNSEAITGEITNYYVVHRNDVSYLGISFLISDTCADNDDEELIGITVRLDGENPNPPGVSGRYTFWETTRPTHSHQNKIVEYDDGNFICVLTLFISESKKIEVGLCVEAALLPGP